ncbi:MAG: hypothetical protein P3M75_00390 [Candidatus Hodgkinia cicadicola]|nr:MAG: hypothetical protein P3M75_00390 [Candidatus Hodgkinia cicadicola]
MFVVLTGLPEGVDATQTFCAWRSGIDFASLRSTSHQERYNKSWFAQLISSVIALLAKHNIGVICARLGEFTESNVLLARFASAWIVAFDTKASIQTKRLAHQLGVKLVKSELACKPADAITELAKPLQDLKVFPSDQTRYMEPKHSTPVFKTVMKR